MNAEERLWEHVDKRGPDECWEWQGHRHGEAWGYGRLCLNGTRVYAHRLSYEIANGPISDGLTIDHLCRNHKCVNPAHLEAVTRVENVLRGEGPTATNARKTHCKHGHEFTEGNTYVTPSTGYRRCRACHRESLKMSNRRRRERANA